VRYSLELSGYDAERAKSFQQQLMARLAALPGVQSVSLNRVFVGRGIITLLDQGRTAVEPVLRLFVKTFEESIAGAQTIMSAASHGATALGTLALMLAVIGLYGVMAWSVVQHTREIGIRMALGAQVHNVLVLVLSQGMKLVLLGAVIGIPASLGVARLLSSMLVGFTTGDALTIGVVTTLLLGVTLLACYLPARRATRVDPLETLRYE